jgi:hypothetical protein
MLPFRVIQIERHRTVQPGPAKLSLPELCQSKLSLGTRSLPDTLHAKLNRQIAKLERAVTLRKQTAEDSSNRPKIQKRLSSISASSNFFSTQDFANSDSQNTELPMRKKRRFLQSGRPFLPASDKNIGGDVTQRKQMAGEFLPGATTTPSRAPEFHKIAQGFDELHY